MKTIMNHQPFSVPKAQRKVKGMTLIECIIALLVVGIAGTIMVTCGTVVSRLRMETTHINNKTNAELPLASTRRASAVQDYIVTVTNEGETEEQTVSATENLSVSVGSGSASDANRTMSATYNTYDATKYNTRAAGQNAVNANTHMQSDLEFYLISPPAEETP